MVRKVSKFPRILALTKKIELSMLVLSFIWLSILVFEIAYGGNPLLSDSGTIIWCLFILYFVVRLMAVANRAALLKRNWIFILAISVSALRFFPVFHSFPLVRALTATFGMQVIWIFASADQGMRSIRHYLGRRGVGYALALTFVVAFAGAAGMLHFEMASEEPQSIRTFSRALWWTAMQLTNLGSAYSIKSTGGRILCLAISVYAAAMFGYLTALIATFFIDREVKESKPEIAAPLALQSIQLEIVQLRRLVEGIDSRLAHGSSGAGSVAGSGMLLASESVRPDKDGSAHGK